MAVSGNIKINVFGGEAEGTMVSECLRSGGDNLAAVLADEAVISGNEIFSHVLLILTKPILVVFGF